MPTFGDQRFGLAGRHPRRLSRLLSQPVVPRPRCNLPAPRLESSARGRRRERRRARRLPGTASSAQSRFQTAGATACVLDVCAEALAGVDEKRRFRHRGEPTESQCEERALPGHARGWVPIWAARIRDLHRSCKDGRAGGCCGGSRLQKQQRKQFANADVRSARSCVHGRRSGGTLRSIGASCVCMESIVLHFLLQPSLIQASLRLFFGVTENDILQVNPWRVN
mmetsp:Transcript_38707/g.72605  ORF Transcript_38707/g.72605 Transcript_38707/m.72605 type:complete len:224 (+) Transcript_38707:2571-3242(+)